MSVREDLAEAARRLSVTVIVIRDEERPGAADELTRARAENERLREMLTRRIRLEDATIRAGYRRPDLREAVPMIDLVGRSQLLPIGARERKAGIFSRLAAWIGGRHEGGAA